MIDTLAMYQKLKASGLKSKQAEAITRAIYLAHSVRQTDSNDEIRTKSEYALRQSSNPYVMLQAVRQA